MMRGVRGNRPAVAYGVNKASPLSSGLLAYWASALNGPLDLVSGARGTIGVAAQQGLPLGGTFISPAATSATTPVWTVPSVFGGLAQVTMNAWVYRTATTQTCQSFCIDPASNDTTFGFWLFNDGNIYWYNSSAVGTIGYASCVYSGVGAHMLTLVFDGSRGAGTARFTAYIDAVPQTLTLGAAIGATIQSTINSFGWGRDRTGGGFRYSAVNGVETALWNRALTPGEVSALYSTRWDLYAAPVRGHFDVSAVADTATLDWLPVLATKSNFTQNVSY